MDVQRLQDHFPGWIGTIISRHCQEALRRLRARASYQLTNEQAVQESRDDLDMKIDFNMLLQRLSEPARTVVTLYHSGWTITEIALRLKFSYWKACRLLQSGLRTLAHEMGEDND
jgi:RNA polymerase sigma factor (sigma-70 family)